MTINICVIEDEELFQEQILKIAKQYETEKNVNLKVTCYDTFKKSLLINTEQFHVFFLDIQLTNENGVNIARQLRNAGYTGAIVFLTSYEEYVFDGYDVNALNYLLKPLTYEHFSRCINRILERLESKYFSFRYKGTYERVPYDNILYFTSRNQYTEIIKKEDTQLIHEPLKNILGILPLQFVQCHRTVILNLDYVEKIMKKDAYLSDGTVIPISRQYLNTVREQFLKHLQLR